MMSLLVWLLFSAQIAWGYSSAVYEETYYSPAVTLHPGQIANTDPYEFSELDWPKKPIAITYFASEVVDQDGNSVPLYDLYIHHWLIFVDHGKYSMGWCEIYNLWGIGAEMRGTIYEYPSPYAVIFDGNETWTANLHFIRTDTVPTDDHQKCIECHCDDGTPTNPHGSISCCPDQSFCYGMPNSTTDPQKYYLKYTIKYTDVTDDIVPITYFAFDVTSQNNFDCRIEYQVSEQSVTNGNLNIWQNETTVPQDTNIVLVEIHQHIGGVNYSVEHYRNNKYIDTLCEASPIYGNSTEVGNENGYVVKIPTCTFTSDNPYQVQKDDILKLKSIYNGQHIEGGGDYHEGVMGLLFYWGERTGPSTCESKLKEFCGDPLPASTDDCISCAKEHLVQLEFADCGGSVYNWKIVDFLCLTDNGKKTPYPINNQQNNIQDAQTNVVNDKFGVQNGDPNQHSYNVNKNEYFTKNYVYQKKKKQYSHFKN